MHSALSIASLLLAASGTLAYPQAVPSNATASTASVQGADTEVRVILQSQSTETGSQTAFKNVDVRKHKKPVGSSGPFETIEISVGADAQQDLRCQALGMDGKPLIATRGANIDITFSDADGGPWDFAEASEVSKIICDPAFKKLTPQDFQVNVTLSNGRQNSYTTTFGPVVERVESPPTGSEGPFDTVEISVGSQVDPALRCALENRHGRPIVAKRGENVDTTFSDADKGPWSFRRSHRVSNVICDPEFVAAPQE